MKKVILKYKQPISKTHYDEFYSVVPAFLTRLKIKKLYRKKCWDIEIIDDQRKDKKDGIYNHIPRID